MSRHGRHHHHGRRRPPLSRAARHALGIAGVMVGSAAVALAAGIPGIAGGEAAGQAFVDDVVRARVAADAIVEVPPTRAEDRDLVDAVEGRSAGTGAGATDDGTPRQYVRDYRRVAYEEARRAGIRRPWLFVRQMAAESGYQQCVESHAGAIGIAQIMPATARGWNVDPHMPEQALRRAAESMALYERRYGSYRVALAAYNAGPGAVAQYGGVPPYEETRTYISRIYDISYPLPGLTQVYRTETALRSDFNRRLRALIADVTRHGGRVSIRSGWRSYEQSERIWIAAKEKYGGWEAARRHASPPGCSNHVRGLAADLTGDLAVAHSLAGRHGLVFPIKADEPWHVEPVGIERPGGR